MNRNDARLQNHDGGSFDDFLKEEGIFEEVHLRVLKRILAEQLKQEMDAQSISKVEMARKMGTSRAALDRLLGENHNVTLETVGKAAAVLGKCLKIDLIDRNDMETHAC